MLDCRMNNKMEGQEITALSNNNQPPWAIALSTLFFTYTRSLPVFSSLDPVFSLLFSPVHLLPIFPVAAPPLIHSIISLASSPRESFFSSFLLPLLLLSHPAALSSLLFQVFNRFTSAASHLISPLHFPVTAHSCDIAILIKDPPGSSYRRTPASPPNLRFISSPP
jgi:hypothetical protein